MKYENEKIIDCVGFEEALTDYIDGLLPKARQVACAEHVLKCPLCHSLLNEVKRSLEVCHEISAPKMPLTKVEARILTMTMPETAMSCEDFERHLTDYLDGFLPAAAFHRWERHAVLCEKCTDLPGEVVRSIGSLISLKSEEMPLPAGLHSKILEATLGTADPQSIRSSGLSRFGEWIRSWKLPISIPQLAPVAMMMAFAFMVLTQTVSADGSISGMYQRSFELARETYMQSSGIVLGEPEHENDKRQGQEPIEGQFVNEGR